MSVEQNRIVARVEALIHYCDALEEQLRHSQALGSWLLEAAVHHLVAN